MLAQSPSRPLPIASWQHFAHFQVWRREAQTVLNTPRSLGDALFHLHRGRVYLELDRIQKAEAELEAAVAIRPADLGVWTARAAVFERFGRTDEWHVDFSYHIRAN